MSSASFTGLPPWYMPRCGALAMRGSGDRFGGGGGGGAERSPLAAAALVGGVADRSCFAMGSGGVAGICGGGGSGGRGSSAAAVGSTTGTALGTSAAAAAGVNCSSALGKCPTSSHSIHTAALTMKNVARTWRGVRARPAEGINIDMIVDQIEQIALLG